MEHDQTRQKELLPPTQAIVVRGLPGTGKTTLTNRIAELLRFDGHKVMHINADAVRASLNSDLGFDEASRVENARRLGCVALLARMNGLIPVVDFVMPTLETNTAFKTGFQSNRFTLWRVKRGPDFKCRFSDTDQMFQNSLFGIDLHYTLPDVDRIAREVIEASRS